MTPGTGWVDVTHIELGDEGVKVLMAGLCSTLTVGEEPRQLAVATLSQSSSILASVPQRRVHSWLKVQLLGVLGRAPPPIPAPASRSFRGITTLRLNQNGIGNEGLYAVLAYATQDCGLTEVFLECNNITVRDRVDGVLKLVRSSTTRMV